MNTCEGEELSKESVDKRKNKYDLAIDKLRLKFRGAFLSEQGVPEKRPRDAMGARKCCFDQQHENLCSL